MDRQGYIDFLKQHSTKRSAKASNYVMALKILDELLPYQDEIDLQGRSLYDISDFPTLESLLNLLLDEQAKMRNGKQSIFDYGKANQKSYPLNNFCSAA